MVVQRQNTAQVEADGFAVVDSRPVAGRARCEHGAEAADRKELRPIGRDAIEWGGRAG